MSIFDRALGRIQENMSKEINCIPWGLPRFESYLPGIMQKRYYIVTASSGVSKSQFTNAMFVYNVYDFIKANPGIKAKIFYWSLEIDAETMILQGISRKLFLDYGIIADTTKLLSYGSNRCSTELLEKIKLSRNYFEELEDILEIHQDGINPFGIRKRLIDYANSNGKVELKDMPFTLDNGTIEMRKVFDYYTPTNPNEYVISITDHLALLSLEKDFSGSKDIKGTIEKHSNNGVELRNKYGYVIVDIQQQSAEKESNESFKLNKLEPSAQGLGESKLVARQSDVIFGLFSPARHELATYRKYDITKLKDNYRFLQIVKNRHGIANVSTHLYFNGAVNYFAEMPRVEDLPTNFYSDLHNIMKPKL